jgi:hypothetical protein
MSVTTVTSQLFPTALRQALPLEFDCANRVVSRDAGKMALPRRLSPRITNKALVQSLTRDTAIPIPSPRQLGRVIPPPSDRPIFDRLPNFNPRSGQRQGSGLCPEAQQAVDDPRLMPEDPEILRYMATEIRLERDHLGDEGF